MAGALQRAAETERSLTYICTRWLGGEESRILRMSWHQKLKFAASATSALPPETAHRLRGWLEECDTARRRRNELAHSTVARIMVGPGEDECDADPDRVALLRDEAGRSMSYTMSRDDFAALQTDLDRVAQAGFVLDATALHHLELPRA